MTDVAGALIDYNRGRDPERLALKYRRMKRDAFTFLRGSCHLFYGPIADEVVLQRAPKVWACGDLHLENCGSYRGDNRQVYFDISDFDEALLAPARWDLVRILASVLVGRKTFGATKSAARVLGQRLIRAYAAALTDGKPRWVERETATSPVRELLDHVRTRKQRAWVKGRIQVRRGRPRLRLGDHALQASQADQQKVTRFLAAHHEQLRVLDVARRIAGTGSLGLERYAILVANRDEPDRMRLLDLKLAQPSSSVRYVRARQPRFADQAQRIVAVQHRMQAITIASLEAVRIDDTAFVLRRLLPSEDRVDLTLLRKRPAQVATLLEVMGQCLAWDQLRSSGRHGSDDADALRDHGRDASWQAKLLLVAEQASACVERDYAAFAKAYEEGAFELAR